jgi:hypothetical protein
MKRILIILFIAVFLLTACGAAATPQALTSGAGESKSFNGPSAPPAAPMPALQANDAAQGVRSPNPVQDRIVVQTVDMSVVVKDPQAKMSAIGALARKLGGFVVSSNLSQTTIANNVKVPEAAISIRVPAKELDNALVEIKADTVEVQYENRNGQDVTDKYVDLQSQLKAKQAAADKLYEILQKTEKADDTLAVFNQLTQVQGEIEVLKGQINYFDQAASLSVISVRLVSEETVQPLTIAGWKPQGVARDAVQALIDFFQNFASFLIWLVIFIIPVAAVVLVLLALLWRLVRWFWVKIFPRKAALTPPADEKN